MSKVAEQKRNWLDQVKADAEAITRKRLAEDLPKMERELDALNPQPAKPVDEKPAGNEEGKKGTK
jgi:hypothetical protein